MAALRKARNLSCPGLGEVVEVLAAVDVAAVAAHHRDTRGLLLRAHAEERLGLDGAAAAGGAGPAARGDAEGRGLAEEGAAGGEGGGGGDGEGHLCCFSRVGATRSAAVGWWFTRYDCQNSRAPQEK